MPALARDVVEAGLLKKGFVLEDSGKDHRYYKLHLNGKYTGIVTKVSRGSGYKSLGNDLVSMMARQVKLKTAEFCDLVQCPMSAEKYVETLRERGEPVD
jgi:hypothetical protein